MKYSHEFKLKCVELYRNGIWAKTPKNTNKVSFRKNIRLWVRTEDIFGIDALKHKNFSKKWTPEEKLELITQVIAGKSITEVAVQNRINSGQLYQWVRKYKIEGYQGLVNIKKGRPSKEPSMKKKVKPAKLNESELEELIRLRAENEYIKAENEVIKKEIALREEKRTALLKAKKQRSSKNSEKKDIN